MLPRERVLAALAHQEPDHVPLDLGGTDVTGIHARTYRRLLAALHVEAPAETPILDMVQQLAAMDEEVMQRLHSHCRGVFPDPPSSWRFTLHDDDAATWFRDEWGIVWQRRKPDALYFDIAHHPLADAAIEDVRSYPWPDPADPARRASLVGRLTALHEAGEYAVILSGISGGGAMELAAWLAGFENFYAALLADPTFADELLDHTLDAKLAFWERVLPEVGPYVDVISESEDLGLQDRLLISPRAFRRHIKPRLRQLIAGIKACAPHVKVLLHSDGAILPILPDLIEVGVDVLNPVQVSAADMGDTAMLKREFGGSLAFWGGIDTQRVLPFGTPRDVADEVRRRIDDLASGGGYILGSVHNIQADVPVDNVLAMVQAWQTYG